MSEQDTCVVHNTAISELIIKMDEIENANCDESGILLVQVKD